LLIREGRLRNISLKKAVAAYLRQTLFDKWALNQYGVHTRAYIKRKLTVQLLFSF